MQRKHTKQNSHTAFAESAFADVKTKHNHNWSISSDSSPTDFFNMFLQKRSKSKNYVFP